MHLRYNPLPFLAVVCLCFGCGPSEGDVYEELLTGERYEIGADPGSPAGEIEDFYEVISTVSSDLGLSYSGRIVMLASENEKAVALKKPEYDRDGWGGLIIIIPMEMFKQKYRKLN